ncbi:hypothetical protein JYK00_00630 [Thermosipho ferrireducens]|uniref:Uncharacterized protein n=1 Tax=Thermosipho ferrireducens TaxID=2571116 RepID=A0ABX7S8W4_9BACT|nr:hypothetical protein [Thermosipho ferrireducens]QTA38087.1 hypothetical protein JYK00_00630 [Thermosipho ferrireducens]
MMRILLIVSIVFTLSISLFSQGILSLPKEKLAFPYDYAGFAIWIELKEVPDFEIVGKHVEQILEVSDNHILGWKSVGILNETKVYIYADVKGYLVIFLHKDTPPAAIIDFRYVNFEKRHVKTFSILNVMENILTDLGYDYVSLLSDIKFADFQHPEANSFLVALTRTKPVTTLPGDRKWYEEKTTMHIAVNEKSVVYSYSYTFGYYGVYRYDRLYQRMFLNLDGNNVLKMIEDNVSENSKSLENYTFMSKQIPFYIYYREGKDERILLKKLDEWRLKRMTISFDPLKPHTYTLVCQYWSNYEFDAETYPIHLAIAIVIVYKK